MLFPGHMCMEFVQCVAEDRVCAQLDLLYVRPTMLACGG